MKSSCIYILYDGETIDFTGLYTVNEYGEVFSLVRGIVLKKSLKKNGYNQVVLFKNGERYYCKVSRLVASNYQNICGDWFYKAEVDHINTIRTDDSAHNLRWLSRSDNQQNPLTKQHKSILRKNRPDQSIPIIQYDLEWNYIKEWPSAMEAQRQLGCSSANIYHCCRGRRNTHHGYRWAYKKGLE